MHEHQGFSIYTNQAHKWEILKEKLTWTDPLRSILKPTKTMRSEQTPLLVFHTARLPKLLAGSGVGCCFAELTADSGGPRLDAADVDCLRRSQGEEERLAGIAADLAVVAGCC